MPKLVVIPEFAEQMFGIQKAKQNKDVWACGLRLRLNRDDDKLHFFTASESDRIRTRVILLGMVSLSALRQHPRFARFFELVRPFFWPVIWWTLNAVFRQYDASNRIEFLLGITWWGQVYIAFEGDLRPDPLNYKPVTRTFRPLTDGSWASDLPTNLERLSPFEVWHALILPRFSGGLPGSAIARRSPRQGISDSFLVDTS